MDAIDGIVDRVWNTISGHHRRNSAGYRSIYGEFIVVVVGKTSWRKRTPIYWFVVGAGGWATTTELAGAVIATGTVVVEGNVKVVQQIAGHSSAVTTLDVYAQLFAHDAHSSARAVDALLNGDVA